MSYDPCKYCHQPAFKTNGDAELICFNRAETGDCNTPPLKTMREYEELKQPRKRPDVDIKKEYELIQQKNQTFLAQIEIG